MRKLIFFTVTGIFSLNLFCFYMAYQVAQKDVIRSAEETAAINEISNGSLLQLTKTDFDSLNWTRKGKEFKLNGRVFDVSHIVVSDSGVDLYVEENKTDTAEPGKTVFPASVIQS